MANRVSAIINQICRFAKINGYHQYNIAEDLSLLFPKPKKDANFEGFPAITDKDGVSSMLQKIDKFIEAGRCSPYMAAALRIRLHKIYLMLKYFAWKINVPLTQVI